jgi:type I restriction enzyme S subunit
LEGEFLINPLNLNYDLKSLRISRSKINVVVSQGYIVLQLVSKDNPEYFRFLLRDFDIRHLKSLGSGVRQTISFTHLLSEELPLPPISEQQQIVSYLDTKTSLIDSLIEKTQRKIELLKEKRTSLINEVVTKGLNPNVEMKDSGVEWIGEIPSHWVLSKVMYELEFHNNIRVPLSSEERGERQGEYRYYGSTGIIDYIDDYLFDGEFILIGEDGSNLRLRTYRLSNVVTGKFWVNNHSHILRIRVGNNYYYSHLLELTDFSNYITGSTQPKLTMDNLKIVPMISPPLTEQNEIVSYLDEHTQLIDNTISIEEKRIELLKEYRQSLISEVVTGKRKVVN